MGNFFELANLIQRKGNINIRLERIKREGSPNYNYALPLTAPAAIVTLHIPGQFPESRKYQPLDSIEIVNNEPANPLNITINNRDTYYCPAGAIRTIHGRGIALWQLSIENLGVGNTTLGLVQITMKKEAMTVDKWASEQ